MIRFVILRRLLLIIPVVTLLFSFPHATAFSPSSTTRSNRNNYESCSREYITSSGVYMRNKRDGITSLLSKNDNDDDNLSSSSSPSSSYETSDSSSKGIVSSLTNVVNFFMGSSNSDGNTIKEQQQQRDQLSKTNINNNNEKDNDNDKMMSSKCRTPQELMEKIKDDYIVNNYLWTGKIHLPAFELNCQFTDPTISFIGRDTFVSNVENLVPIVNFLTVEDDICQSNLLDIQMNEEKGYIESRWNMYGQLSVLPWKPCINVIGKTKFWYRDSTVGEEANEEEDIGDDESALRVYFYDEQWEMPALRALLQLVTPAGTITA